MDEKVKSYKCPSCGAPLSYSVDSGGFHCEFCEGDFTLDTLEQLEEEDLKTAAESKYDWDSYTPRDFEITETEALSSYNCPSCSAEIIGDSNLGASVCPYCGNATIIKKTFEGTLKPDYVIPFKISKEKALELFEAECGRLPFLPDEYHDKRIIEKTAGIYVPYWMFDCDAQADVTYRAKRVSTWSDSNYNYTKTNHYKLYRSGRIAFRNIPHDASSKTDDVYTEALEPFDVSGALDFDTAYLSGFFADKYDVSVEEARPRVSERIKSTTEGEFMKTTSGYLGVYPEKSGIRFEDSKTRYCLLPVWMIHIEYMNEKYRYAVNGQTGKVVGKYPVCKKKRNVFFLKSFLISAGIIALIMLLLGYLEGGGI